MIKVIKGKVGCKNVKHESLFPRYVFIKVESEVKSVAPVLSTYGVANFVKFGDRYATASKKVIDENKYKCK